MSSPSIALVYDRVNTPHGGAEQVLLALHQTFPDAPLFTSVYDAKKAPWAKVFKVKTSFIQSLPGGKSNHRLYVPLMPLAFESFNLDGYDIVISVTSAEAKGILTKPEQLHMSYMLTPTRYLHSHRTEYEQVSWPFRIPLLSWLSKKLFDYLSWWDRTAASRPDVIIPISILVKKRITQYYNRSTHPVLYPPLQLTEVAIEKSDKFTLPDKFLLVISRLVSYKRIDLAIKAATELHMPLLIVGEGPAKKELESLSDGHTTFLGHIAEEDKNYLLSKATALLMPGVEDFGITAMDAATLGTPVVLHHNSGAAELLNDNETAVHLHKLTTEDLVSAIKKVDHIKTNKSTIRKKLEKYAINNFVTQFNVIVRTEWEKKQKGRYERS
jgi:glycosyltransferase involved in cell wall biosynthesis